MTHIVGSAVSLIDGIKIDDNVPLPPKHSQVKRQREPEIKKTLTIPVVQPAPEILSFIEKEQSRLTMKQLQWRVSVVRYKRNERIL